MKNFNDYEYLGGDGYAELYNNSCKLLFGENISQEDFDRICSVQTLSGSGALKLAGEILKKKLGITRIALSNPTWSNHTQMFTDMGFQIYQYRYYNAKAVSFDLDGMLADLKSLPNDTVVLMQPCGHNPTGIDPTTEQWDKVLDLFKSKPSLLPFFDTA